MSTDAPAFLPLVLELKAALGGALDLPGDLVAERGGEEISSVEAEKDLELPLLLVEARFGVEPLFPPEEIGSLDPERVTRMLPLLLGLLLPERLPPSPLAADREGDIEPVFSS